MDRAHHKLAIRVWAGPLKVETAYTLNKKEFTLINLPYYLVSNLKGILENL
jgi:uncharacterized protein